MNISFPHSIAIPHTSKLPAGDRSSIRCVSVARPYGGYANEEDRSWGF
ncbi:MAG TPA: hypothetical protein VLA84_23855 [Microcoleus sp.]|nr:hypothetical protein [Microcoleus sp.]